MITEKTNEELVADYQQGDKEAMATIVEKNRGLVIFHVNRYRTLSDLSYLDTDDMEQLGFIGLMQAVKKFNPNTGFKFASYASVAIKGHITRGLRYSTPWEDKRDNNSQLVDMVSAQATVPGTEDLTYGESLKDPVAENEFSLAVEQLDHEILRKDIFSTFNQVFKPDEREKNVLILRYGLNGHEYTLSEIAGLYGLSVERARQLVGRGIKRINRSKAGYLLKQQYMLEYDLIPRVEKLSRLAYKDPSWYSMEIERIRQAISPKMEQAAFH